VFFLDCLHFAFLLLQIENSRPSSLCPGATPGVRPAQLNAILVSRPAALLCPPSPPQPLPQHLANRQPGAPAKLFEMHFAKPWVKVSSPSFQLPLPLHQGGPGFQCRDEGQCLPVSQLPDSTLGVLSCVGGGPGGDGEFGAVIDHVVCILGVTPTPLLASG
jgi:hypothetical protein